jgi:hypothetical protein
LAEALFHPVMLSLSVANEKSFFYQRWKLIPCRYPLNAKMLDRVEEIRFDKSLKTRLERIAWSQKQSDDYFTYIGPLASEQLDSPLAQSKEK